MIYTGNNLDILPTLPADHFDSIVTDPPYGLGFMGREWDHAVPGVPFWEAMLRVAKPGAYLVAFGAPRLYHRMACYIEDAGWEIRDTLMWVYGSGFPKSMDVAKAIDKLDRVGPMRDRALLFTAWMRSTGLTARQINEATRTNMASHYLTALEQPAVPTRELFELIRPLLQAPVPAFVEDLIDSRVVESENLARREVIGHHDQNAPAAEWRERYDGGGASTAKPITAAFTDEAKRWQGWGTALKPAWEPIVLARKPFKGTVAANVMRNGTGALNVDGCRVEGGEIASAGGTRRSGGIMGESEPLGGWEPKHSGRWPANLIHDGSDEVVALFPADQGPTPRSSGPAVATGALFDAPKPEATPAEPKAPGTRPGGFGNVGADKGSPTPCGPMYEGGGSAARFFYSAKASTEDRHDGLRGVRKDGDNTHPTVKPTDLMRWLCRLVTPPGGLVLDPFCGSGSTGRGAIAEGFQFVGIELDPENAAIAEARTAVVQPGLGF